MAETRYFLQLTKPESVILVLDLETKESVRFKVHFHSSRFLAYAYCDDKNFYIQMTLSMVCVVAKDIRLDGGV